MLANLLIPVFALASTSLAYPAVHHEMPNVHKREPIGNTGWYYEGYCLIDNARIHELLSTRTTLSSPSYSSCIDHCVLATTVDRPYDLAGIIGGNQCLCAIGAEIQLRGFSLSNNCAPCTPGSSEFCGGSNVLTALTKIEYPGRPASPYDADFVYCQSSGCIPPCPDGRCTYPPEAPPPPPPPPPSKHLDGWRDSGYCLRDSVGDLRLLEQKKIIANMDHKACETHCESLKRGYDLAGIEFGKECVRLIILFDIPVVSQRLTHFAEIKVLVWTNDVRARSYYLSKSCSLDCPGDKSLRCGGSKALTILVKNRNDIGTMPAPDQIDINKQQCHDNVCPVLQDQYAVAPVKGSDNFVYSGYCVADLVDGSTRVFTAKKVFVDLTQAMCADHCSTRGYDVAGIENRDECWCAFSSEIRVYKLSTLCTNPCFGDPTTRCGGPKALTALTNKKITLPVGGVPRPPFAPTGLYVS